jgi:hypothetical protein
MNQQLFPDTFLGARRAAEDPRKAALLLHAMSPEDQRWVLGHLPADQRGELRDLLAELMDLGIPVDRNLLNEVVSASSPSPLPAAASAGIAPLPRDKSDEQGLESADIALLSRVLKDEPTGLIARLLDLSDWPWTEAFLVQLDPAKRRQIESLRNPVRFEVRKSGVEAGHALRAQLLRGVKVRLAGEQARVAPEAGAGMPGRQTFSAVRKAWWRLGQLSRSLTVKRPARHGRSKEGSLR